MALFYITGVAGSGKSAVQQELRRLGYEAHDVDDPSVGAPYHTASNRVVTMPPVSERTPEWFATHSWRISHERIHALKEHSRDHAIFVCGTAGNEREVWDLFDTILCLDIDEATLRSRLAKRLDNDFGSSPHELSLILERQRAFRRLAARLDVKMIDATQPLEEVVRRIVRTAGTKRLDA